MAVPILKQHNYLIVSIQAELTDVELLELRDELAERVGTYRSRGVVLDVSALDVLDSFATRTVQTMAQMAKLRGAVTVVVGIQPEVAFAMVEMGLGLDGVAQGLDLEDGLATLDRITASKDSNVQ